MHYSSSRPSPHKSAPADSVVRGPRPDLGVVLVDKDVVDNPEISFAALGLYTWLSHYEAMDITAEDEARCGGHEQLVKILDELSTHGLIEGGAQ